MYSVSTVVPAFPPSYVKFVNAAIWFFCPIPGPVAPSIEDALVMNHVCRCCCRFRDFVSAGIVTISDASRVEYSSGITIVFNVNFFLERTKKEKKKPEFHFVFI